MFIFTDFKVKRDLVTCLAPLHTSHRRVVSHFCIKMLP